MRNVILYFTAFLLMACGSQNKQDSFVILQNPIIPGYFADPSIVEHKGKFYMYATADPWGGNFLSCWESDDFRNWTFNKLNWPTKEACTSLLSNENMVWAPSVVKRGGVFYMYISVGSEIWCGKANHPLGPWENVLEDKPMIPYDTTRYYHVIDAEAFIDDDDKAYLYWGSGWDWKNGRCFAAELNDDMASFRTEPVEVTPNHYFEGPLMLKHQGKYYLTYSEGKTIEDTYEVRYAVGNNPFGPFEEADNSPILTTYEELEVYGPGHHTVFNLKGKDYILYHRHSLPFVSGTALRQTCIQELIFDDAHNRIKNIVPEHTQLFPDLTEKEDVYIRPVSVQASSEQATYRAAGEMVDNDYSTRWEASEEDAQPNIVFVLEEVVPLSSMEIRFEYPWKTYYTRVEASTDREVWTVVADHIQKGVTGSPVTIPINVKGKYIRLSFERLEESGKPSVWEVRFR